MAMLSNLGERKILYLRVNESTYNDKDIEKVYAPSESTPYWQFYLKDGSVLISTGNITLQHSGK